MSTKRGAQWEVESDMERSRNSLEETKHKLHNVSDTSSWYMESEEDMEEQNFQKISVAVNDVASKVETDITEKTEIHEMKVHVNDNIVSNVKGCEANLKIKEELEDQEDEDSRIQKEFDIFEHEWARELKQERLDVNGVKDASIIHVSSGVTKQEKNDQTEDVDDVENMECMDRGIYTPKSVKVESDFFDQTSEKLDVDKQIKAEDDDSCSAVEQMDGGHIKKEKEGVCPESKEEEFHNTNIKEVNNFKTEDVNINKVKEEGTRKRGRDWHTDRVPEKVPHRERPRSESQDRNKSQKVLELETDPDVLSRRQKQIDYGKNTIGYDRYRQLVPKERRTMKHPKTPPKHLKYSRRAWDGMIRVWRQKLHFWDPPSEGKSDISDTLSDISVEVRSETSDMSGNGRHVRVKRNTQSSAGSCSLEDETDDFLMLDDSYTDV